MDSPLTLNGQVGFYQVSKGCLFLDKGRLAIVASDGISAFDHILPRAIPGKGQMLMILLITFYKPQNTLFLIGAMLYPINQ